jgi:parallel beta-helix repeat protein
VLCGTSGSVLDGGGVDDGYVLHLDGADYWHLTGFSVTNGQKGVMADGTTGTVIEGLTVTKIGDEAIHLRNGSTDNVVSGNTISGTGHRRDKFGEGIYIGTAESNWCDISNCEADASDRNVIEGNTITDTTAEAIDIKEGTSDGIVRDNTFDGSGLQGDADSWIDVKGNGWLIEGNVGVDSPGDGFQTHEVVDGWGTDNVFRGNTAQVNGPGYGFALKPEAGNTVSCDNTATGAASGLSNEPCSG